MIMNIDLLACAVIPARYTSRTRKQQHNSTLIHVISPRTCPLVVSVSHTELIVFDSEYACQSVFSIATIHKQDQQEKIETNMTTST